MTKVAVILSESEESQTIDSSLHSEPTVIDHREIMTKVLAILSGMKRGENLFVVE